ncbi:two-component regulator propeller domain-containing protein [uncultured Polaribacter sp.]|uniref:hybrid sensor histidine kinase/response regulator transcription factor n=1 Tax=uncultured Polaribacter sp. TaxID=174711 RepID=UPI00260815A4|nr:two-component regulator propeller domain-containing protein [uncultured Polaribacter sp.]
MIRSVLFLFFVMTFSIVNSQNRSFSFKYLNTSSGLSSNTINGIHQDKLGQMWFATNNGLNKFDGNTFIEFKNDGNKNKKPSLTNNNVLSVFQDKGGLIWVGTVNGLNKYDSQKNKFRNYYSYADRPNSLGGSLVISGLEVANGEIWFGTDIGVSIYHKKKDNFTRILYNVDDKIAVNNIFLDSKKQIWLATSVGLINVKKNKSGDFTFNTFNLKSIENNLFVNTIFETEPGVLSIGTKYNGYLTFHTKTSEFIRPSEIEIPNNIDVQDFEKDNDGNLWIATKNGLFIFLKSKKTIVLKEDKNLDLGINQNYIKTIFKDKSGSMWLGTESKGINLWNKVNENFTNIKNTAIFNNVAKSITADKSSNIYFGTQGGVVNKIDKQGKVLEIFKVQNKTKTIEYVIESLLFTEPNLLWIGTLNHGLLVYDLQSRKINNKLISKQLKTYLNNEIINHIKIDNQGNLWLGTFGKGVVKYHIKTQKITNITRPQVATNIIKTICIDDDKNVVLGGVGGITILTSKKNGNYSSKRFLYKSRYLRFNINKVHKDANNTLWAGTATKGLYKFDGEDFKKVFLDVKNKVSTVYNILEGKQDILWLSTEKGIVKYNSRTKSSTFYQQKNNNINNEFLPNSGLKLKNQFYFGSIKGLTTFNVDKLQMIQNVPKTLLSDLKIKNQSVRTFGEQEVLSKSIHFAKEIKLNHKNSNFSISYALPNYINSDGNKYAYRLKGLDDNWMFTNQTEAFFTLQNAGTYTFQVKGANYNNIWNNKPTSIKIIVKPAPWKTWWAYSLYFLTVFGLFYGFNRILQSKERLKNKLELEYLENQRIEDLNKSKLQFFTNISHEFRTPLTLILGPLQNILDDYTGTNAIYKKLKVVEGSANHLLRLINRLMDFRKLESNQLELKAAEGNIVKFLQEIYLSFSEHAKVGKYSYEFNASQDVILVYFDRYKLERVFYNLISNAFRYTPKGGQISIDIKKEKEEVLITVKDSGVGISEEYLDKIFDRFFEIPIHNNPEKNYNKGTGIGLSIANNIVKLHRGFIDVKNQKPNGAIFTVRLKLGSKHLLENEILEDFKMSDDVSQYAAQINIPEADQSIDIKDTLLEDKKYTILIAEDNVVLRSFIKEILKPIYNVLLAENGKVALQKAIKHLPDLVISDVIMPEMVGTELCSKIKTTMATSHIPVILLTSRTSLIYKFEGLESGADDYISKPFNLKEFQLKIKNLLSSKEKIKDKFSSKENYTEIDVSLPSIDEKMLSRAFEIVKDNLANQDFNIEEFSEALGVSRSILYTKIKAWANTTPKDFIQEIRLNHAAKLLELDKFNISEICYKVGFKRPKYFSQCFHKKYSLTPSEYSKKFKSSL